MKFLIIFLLFLINISPAFSAEEAASTPPQKTKTSSPAQKAQQEKMKACSAQAKEMGKKGDERKAFMKTCLGGEHPLSTSCEKQALEKKLTGAAKQEFVETCKAAAK